MHSYIVMKLINSDLSAGEIRDIEGPGIVSVVGQKDNNTLTIQLMKLFREFTGCGLKEVKTFTDTFLSMLHDLERTEIDQELLDRINLLTPQAKRKLLDYACSSEFIGQHVQFITNQPDNPSPDFW